MKLRITQKHIMVFGLLSLAFGAATFFYGQYVHSQAAAAVQTPPRTVVPVELKPATISGDPVKLDIPALNLSLDIIHGNYDPVLKTWTLTKDKVQYATNTVLPNNQTGDTFIYGHNRVGVFSTLHSIPSRAVAIVTTADGHLFYYTLASVRTTVPTDDSLFYYQGTPILTIQTCSGAYYQDRQLFTFRFQRVV